MRTASSQLNRSIAVLLAQIRAAVVMDSQTSGNGPDEHVVRESWNDLQTWDNWLTENRRAMSPQELNWHEMSIRWAKGIVKAWRLNLVNRRNLS